MLVLHGVRVVPLYQGSEVSPRVTAATASSMRVNNTLVPISFQCQSIVYGSGPAHREGKCFRCSTQRAQKQFPFLSVKFTEKHAFLRALPIARPVPSPNCPLTAVCKLTSGTRPRDALISLRGFTAADGREKLSHSEVQLLI